MSKTLLHGLKRNLIQLQGHIQRMALPEYMDADVQGGKKRLFMLFIRCSSPVIPFLLAACSTLASVFCNPYNEKSPETFTLTPLMSKEERSIMSVGLAELSLTNRRLLFIKDGYAKLGATVEQAAKWNGSA